MKRQKVTAVFLFAVLVIFGSRAEAEDIKNYSNCAVCYGAIHYGHKEAKEIIGRRGISLFSKLTSEKTVKIDLDGVLKNGAKKDPDEGYEIKIWGGRLLFIKDLRDESLIQIAVDTRNLPPKDAFNSWQTEIYLESGSSNQINLDDSLEAAWNKMKASNIYRWVVSDQHTKDWNDLLGMKILQAVRLIAQ